MYNQRAVMADIYATRRARLRQLIEERFEGNQSLMARTAGYGNTYFNALLNAVVPMGQRAASRIEAALCLSDGWMDRKPPPGAMPNTPYKARRGQPPKVRSVNDLLNAGYTQREIARQLRVHESTVSRAVQRERAVKKVAPAHSTHRGLSRRGR